MPRLFALSTPLLLSAVAFSPFVANAAPSAILESLDTAQGAIPMDPPEMPPATLTPGTNPTELGDKILYVNFDGLTLGSCFDSSPQNNCSRIFSGTVLPYSGDEGRRASIIQVLRQRLADFGVTVTDTRPTSGDYDMEMVGDWEGVGDQGFAGVAPSIDCNDANGGEISFTLEASGTTDGMAEIILQELAHTWGLEHIDSTLDLLYPTTEGTNKTFRDECIKIVSDVDLTPSNGQCALHTQFCDLGFQNSYQELLALFGPSVADTVPPTVEIVAPADGAVFEESEIELVVALSDNERPAVIDVVITIDGTALPEPSTNQSAFASPNELSFPITDLPDGEYTLTIDGADESENPASDSVTFTIQTGAAGGGDGAGGDDAADGGGGDGGTGSDDDDDDGGSDGGSDGGGAGGGTSGGGSQSEDSGGCGCHQNHPSGTGLISLLSLLLVLGVARKRRAIASPAN